MAVAVNREIIIGLINQKLGSFDCQPIFDCLDFPKTFCDDAVLQSRLATRNINRQAPGRRESYPTFKIANRGPSWLAWQCLAHPCFNGVNGTSSHLPKGPSVLENAFGLQLGVGL